MFSGRICPEEAKVVLKPYYFKKLQVCAEHACKLGCFFFWVMQINTTMSPVERQGIESWIQKSPASHLRLPAMPHRPISITNAWK